MKLDRKVLRKLIIKEINKMKEDALRSQFDDQHRQQYQQSKIKKSRSCQECGYSMYEDESVCEQCGSMYEEESYLNEGGCGCGGSSGVYDGSDYSTDTMGMIGDALGVLTHVDATKAGHREHNNYMAKPSLYKVAKYAEKLLKMIPDGYELDDWQRTKIAQISDDMSEVYHSLDYDKFKGKL
jgi:hypothetical protein